MPRLRAGQKGFIMTDDKKFLSEIWIEAVTKELHKTTSQLAGFLGITIAPPTDTNVISTGIPILVAIANGDNPPTGDITVSVWAMRDLMRAWANAPETFKFLVANALAYLHGNSMITLTQTATMLRHPDKACRQDLAVVNQYLANGYKPPKRDLVYVHSLIERADLVAYYDPRIPNPTKARVIDVEQVLCVANGWDWRDE